MRENPLTALIRETIIDQEAIANIPNTPIAQAFQPTNQGANKMPTGYLHKGANRRYGYPSRESKWDPDLEIMVHTETQNMETDFQFSTLAAQTPSDDAAITAAQYTASDLLDSFAYILQSAKTVEALAAQGVGILRVKDLPNPFFTDDKAQYEASPNLQFTVTHKMIVTSQDNVVAFAELQIVEV